MTSCLINSNRVEVLEVGRGRAQRPKVSRIRPNVFMDPCQHVMDPSLRVTVPAQSAS